MKWQFKIYCFLTIITLLTASCNQEKRQNEAEIKNLSEAYSETYNKSDVDKLTSFYTQDASYNVLSEQRSIQGQNEIANYFKDTFSRENGARFKMMLSDITFQDSDKASADGFVEISFADNTEEKHVYKIDYAKKNNTWLIQSVTELELQTPPSHYEHLKELEWWVGKWIDDDENIDMTLTCKWEKNKNFLVQDFMVKALNHEIIDGQQIITWDPSDERIRSWVYDSDGGFGHSLWSRQGNSWYSSMTFTLPDGRKATATHIYTKVDDNTYTFASVTREIDGKVLPDTGPFKIVRKQ